MADSVNIDPTQNGTMPLGDLWKSIGGFGQLGGQAGSSGLLGLGQLGLSGIGGLGQLWTALGALDLAKQQFNFQKGFANTNLANQTKSYNTALADKANSRYFTQGAPQDAAGYISANSLAYKPV
jgi:hypothetical protein